MKIYVLSRTLDGKILKPKVSRDYSNLKKEMEAEYYEVKKDAGHFVIDIGFLGDGDLVANRGGCRYVWRIDEMFC